MTVDEFCKWIESSGFKDAEARRNNLKVKALGYYENAGLFLDAAGNRVRLEDYGECLGAVVSTMQVFMTFPAR